MPSVLKWAVSIAFLHKNHKTENQQNFLFQMTLLHMAI